MTGSTKAAGAGRRSALEFISAVPIRMMTPPPPRTASPRTACLLSLAAPGWGHLYCRRLDRAMYIWLWGVLLLAVGLLLLLLGLLDLLVPPNLARPPLGDWIRRRPATTLLVWAAAAAGYWFYAAADARRCAIQIAQGEFVVRHSLRRQAVHVMASQLLGLIPFAGFLFAPGMVAEALDAAREKRALDTETVLLEGRQAVRDWLALRIGLSLLPAAALLWLLWWGIRLLKG